MTQDDSYLQWAKELYAWQKDNLVDPETGLVWDNIELMEGVPTVDFHLQSGHLDRSWTSPFSDYRRKRLFARRSPNGKIIDDRAEISTEGILRDEGQGDGGLFKEFL